MEINTLLVSKLIKEQFPQWSHLAIKPVQQSGHDNRTFHLGENMSVRLPSGEAYVGQITKEATWLPILQKGLHLPISAPLAIGKASELFPFPFSINAWIRGESLTKENADQKQLAKDLATFLLELQTIDASQGPRAGIHNFYRGGDLKIYEDETQKALLRYQDVLPIDKLQKIWQAALIPPLKSESVWVHGDVAVGNLLVENQCLVAVIDFGILGVGDPACDYVMAWTYFEKAERELFFKTLGSKPSMIQRAKGWALWKALITYEDENKQVSSLAKATLKQILMDE